LRCALMNRYFALKREVAAHTVQRYRGFRRMVSHIRLGGCEIVVVTPVLSPKSYSMLQERRQVRKGRRPVERQRPGLPPGL
jgi:hypothetical protein